MGIALDEISLLESVKMSVHFVRDRMNDPRNTPPITITELQGIFSRLTTRYISKLLQLKNNDTFNIRCTLSDINIPCAMSRQTSTTGIDKKEIIAITVMRKKNFVSKDPVEFVV